MTQFSVNEKQKVPNGQNKATLGRIFMCYVNSVGIGHRYCTGMLNDLPHCQVENAGPTRSRLKAHKMLKVLLPPMLHPRWYSYLSQNFTGSFCQIRCLLYFCFWYEMQIPSLKICIPPYCVGLNRTETERPDRDSDSGKKNGAIWFLKRSSQIGAFRPLAFTANPSIKQGGGVGRGTDTE